MRWSRARVHEIMPGNQSGSASELLTMPQTSAADASTQAVRAIGRQAVRPQVAMVGEGPG